MGIATLSPGTCAVPCGLTTARGLWRGMGAKTYWVYLLTNASTSVLYVGMTSRLEERLGEHRREDDPDAFSARYRTHRLVHAEPFGEERDAIARERQLKGWTRAKKRALVDAANPEWRDLDPV